MNKRITIIGINYYPEDTAIGLYTTQLANYYSSQGIEVTVITGFPYYPAWKITSEYKSKKTFYKEIINGITIYRYKQYVPKNPTFVKRVIHLLDFSFGSLINILKIKKTDVVLCIVPFTTTILIGKILAKIKKAKLWVHIQDFEFDAVSESSMVDNKTNKSLFFRFLFWIEKKLLNSANVVSTISNSMLLKLENKIVTHVPTKLLPNWVDLNFVNPKTSKKHTYLTSTKFKILYSGNIGEKQDWEFFLKFVKGLQNQKEIEIILVGNGGKRDWLEKKLDGVKNISIHLPVPYSELSDLLCSTDLHILFQKKEVIDTVMPSKILAMMASEKPSLITGSLQSEVASIIKKSNSGKYFDASNINKILEFVYELKLDKKRSLEYGEKARNFVSLNFSKEQVLKQFKNTFIELVK